jgi:hypothetical protein
MVLFGVNLRSTPVMFSRIKWKENILPVVLSNYKADIRLVP